MTSFLSHFRVITVTSLLYVILTYHYGTVLYVLYASLMIPPSDVILQSIPKLKCPPVDVNNYCMAYNICGLKELKNIILL